MKRLLPIVLAIVVILALVVTPLVMFRPERYRQSIVDTLGKAFRHQVLVGGLEGHYFPPHLTIKNLSVLKAADTRYITVDSADVMLGWGALFGGTPAPTRVDISGAHIVISRLANGSWDSADWLPTGAGVSNHGAPPDLVIKKSDVRWVDDVAPAHAELALTGIDGQWTMSAHTIALGGTLNGAAGAAAITLQAKGAFMTGDWSGDVKATDGGRTATFHLLRQGGLWQVSGESSEWRFDNAAAFARFYLRFPAAGDGQGSSMLRSWKTQFTTLGSSATFTHSATIDGGTTEIKGDVRLGAMPQVTFSAALQNVPVASLKPILGSLTEGLDGKVTGVITKFQAPISSSTWTQAQGDFTFEIADGSYRFPSATLQTLKKVKTATYLRKKFPEFDDKGFPFSKARFEGAFENGGLTLRKAGIVSGDVRGAVTGRLETQTHGLDLWLELQIREMLPHLRRELPERYLYGEPGQEKVQPIYGRMQGNWSEWKLRAMSHSKIPGAVQRKLRAGLTI